MLERLFGFLDVTHTKVGLKEAFVNFGKVWVEPYRCLTVVQGSLVLFELDQAGRSVGVDRLVRCDFCKHTLQRAVLTYGFGVV